MDVNWRLNGIGLIKVNGKPLSLLQPEILRFKVREQRISSPPITKLQKY